MGRVAEKYPVYSVHQEGMAPMALFALGEAAGLDYSKPISTGLQWISGNNELGSDLRDTSGVVWRCLCHRRKYQVYLDRARNFVGREDTGESSSDVRVLLECRPYELGWLLYSYAGRQVAAV
jgi:hypothetical protein